MAAVSAFTQQRRRKQATYGKPSRNANAWNVNDFNADDDDFAAPQAVTSRTTKTVRDVYNVHKPDTKQHGLKPIRARAKKQDDFDVPSSDEDVGNSITRRSPPRATAKRKLVDAEEQREPKLAPWEKRAAEPSQTGGPVAESRAASPEAQLLAELQQATPRKESSSKSKEPIILPAKDAPSPSGSSAAARLKARKLLASQVLPPNKDAQLSVEGLPRKLISRIQKRTEHQNVDSNPTPRKRPRSGELLATEEDQDIAMNDAPAPRCESVTPAPESVTSPAKAGDVDIFSFPESSADDIAGSKTKLSRRKSPQQRTRRGKLNTVSRSPALKMDSAPARLYGMRPPSDTDTTESTARSSVSLSRPTTPREAAEKSKQLTPDTAVRTSVAITPKSTEVYDHILEDEASAPSPSRLPIQDLTLKSTERVAAKHVASRNLLTKSSSDVGPARRRTKLVDRLKASAPRSDNESSDDDDSTNEDSTDVPMSSDEVELNRNATSQSQQCSQHSAAIDSGPKITYAARERSYLPEDSFEEGLLLGLPTESHQPAPPLARRNTGKSNSASQQSAFDLDSDDENSGGMKSIHELRAGGGNRRFEDETSSLLSDIADHNASGRSRRRSALIELAKKLGDKTYAEKFFKYGFDMHLLKECGSAPDDVADATLLSILASLLGRDTPIHFAQSIKDVGALQWLVQVVSNRKDLSKLAKDRHSNMSKTAQSAFNDFVGDMAKQENVWDGLKAVTLTIRMLSLKVLEKVTTTLRKAGDRTNLVDREDIHNIAPAQDDVERATCPAVLADLSLSISVLESLYANAATLSWPADVTERLIAIFSLPLDMQDGTQDLHILALRLCTYLTTDSSRNCKAFAKSVFVCYLLRAMLDNFRRDAADLTQEAREKTLALLVPAIGVAINLTLHNDKARNYASIGEAAVLLSDLVVQFQIGQKRMLEAESVEDGVANVAYGSLAVVLANLCSNTAAKQIIASKLPGNNMSTLVAAVEEFLVHHQKVDMMADEAGVEVWGAFTEKLKTVLQKLRLEA